MATAASAPGMSETTGGWMVTHSGGIPVTDVSNCSTTVPALTIVNVVATDSPGVTVPIDCDSPTRTPRFCGARGGADRWGCCGATGPGPVCGSSCCANGR